MQVVGLLAEQKKGTGFRQSLITYIYNYTLFYTYFYIFNRIIV